MASEACVTEPILRPIGGRALRSSADYGGKPVRLLAALAGLGFRGPLPPEASNGTIGTGPLPTWESVADGKPSRAHARFMALHPRPSWWYEDGVVEPGGAVWEPLVISWILDHIYAWGSFGPGSV